MVLMYLVYGSTDYNKEIHVIGTNSVWVYRIYLVYGSTEYNKEMHAVNCTNVLSVWVYRI